MNNLDTASHFAESVLLLDEHLQEWLNSGVDEEIIRLNVSSVSGSELFETLYPKATATQSGTGVRRGDVQKLDICQESVAWEVNGRIKPTAGPLTKKGKYLSASGGWVAGKYVKPPSKLTFLKVPLSIWFLVSERYGANITGDDFWVWVRDNNIPIVLTEGEKKAGCLLSLGFAAISLPGMWMARPVIYRESDGKRDGENLHEDLLEFDTAGREITLPFDYRAGGYFQSVEFKAALATAEVFKSAIAKIAQLPGPDKGVDDFVVGGGDIDAVIGAAQVIDEIQKEFYLWLGKENKKKAWALTHPIAWECNQRYLDIPYPDSGLVCIKSPKGTGKTYALKNQIAKAHEEGRKVLLITHRIVLGRTICDAVEIPWIEEMNGDSDRKSEGKSIGFGLCLDSLHPTSQAAFDPLAWESALVILDEAEQVYWHGLNSATCRENRHPILSTLKTLLKSVLTSGGTVLLQDADLSDISIDFALEFSGINVEPWIAVNHYKPSEPWKIKFYDTQNVKGQTQDNPSGLLKDSVAMLAIGGKIWVSTDSQKAKSKYGSKNLEKYYRSRCPGKRILRIDAETVSNPDHDAYQCAEIINKILGDYDIVICSPSLATGVSVDLRGHFTAVFGIFQGAISDNEVRQSLARVREPVPRFIWCRQIAVGKVGNGESSYKAVAGSTEKDVRYNLRLLKEFDFDIDAASDPVVLRFWAKYAARINASIWDFRETVRDGLEAEGHIIKDCGDDDSDTTEELSALRILNQFEEAVAVASAEDIDRKAFEILENQRAKTDTERHQEEKFKLREIYKVEPTPELRQLDQDRWYGKINLEYLLTHNEDFLMMRDRKHLDGHIKRGDGKICQQDIRLLTGKVTAHKILNTLQFSDPDKEFTNKSPEVIEFVAKALRFKDDLKILTGITVTPKKALENPIGIVSAFVSQFGRAAVNTEQRRVGAERVRFYKFGRTATVNVYNGAGNKISEPERLRSEIFSLWQERDELALFEFQQQGIAIVEADVTVRVKPLQHMASLEKAPVLAPKTEFVTAQTIDIVKTPSVTTNSSIEIPIEPGTEPIGRSGWISRWGKWVQASFLAATDGAQYRMLIEEIGGYCEVLAWPDKIQWDAI